MNQQHMAQMNKINEERERERNERERNERERERERERKERERNAEVYRAKQQQDNGMIAKTLTYLQDQNKSIKDGLEMKEK